MPAGVSWPQLCWLALEMHQVVRPNAKLRAPLLSILGRERWEGFHGLRSTLHALIQSSGNRNAIRRERTALIAISFNSVLESTSNKLTADDFFAAPTHARGPQGQLPITAEMLLTAPSGNLFGLTQNAGMGWNPERLLDPEFLILSTHGGLRAADGTPVALGFHTGHWEVGLLVEAAAQELKLLRAKPFAGACTDPCDGRTQGTTGMMDSLPYRNDAATVL